MVENIKELRKICGSKKKQPLYMQTVGMKVSIYITKLLLYTKISADYVTMSMVALLIGGSFLLGLGNLWIMLAGILLIHLTIFLDLVNGEVARYWKEDGLIGTFLENVYHKLGVPFIFFMTALGVFNETGFTSVLFFGFLCSVFGYPIVLNAAKEAVIQERMEEIERGKPPQQIPIKGKSNVKGGSATTGSFLYKMYDKVRAVWVFPANILHINIIIILELLNIHYQYIPHTHLFLALYLIFYGSVSTFIQVTAFIVNFRGKTVDHYYKKLFSGK